MGPRIAFLLICICAFSVALNRDDFVAFYDNFNGDNWINNSGWKKSADVCDGTWYGISCENTLLGPAALVSLPYNNLYGQFPPSLAGVQLGLINLTGNRVFGKLPSFWTYINAISLSNNQLEGEIPQEYSSYFLLKALELKNNFLTGQIPDMFSTMNTMISIDLGSNLFSGSIPASIGKIGPTLLRINLQNNRLTGTIPSSICANSGVQELTLNINTLSGAIPQCLGQMTQLQNLRLDSNRFNGTIPDTIFDLVNLKAFLLNNNELSGNLSSKISNLKQALVISVAFNRLSGPLPEIDQFTELLAFQLNSNQFTGSIPESFSGFTSLKQLDLSNNRLTGNIPQSFFSNALNITTLLINNNQFSGNMPLDISKLVNLQILDISYNRFNGTIPDVFGLMPFISKIVLSHNDFTGDVPTNFLGFSALSYIDYSFNRLQGRISSNIQFLTQLNTALFNDNMLTGSIPPEIVYLQELERVNLANNFLDGPIPTSAGYLTGLIELDVSNNTLSGELPPSVSSMRSLQKLVLNNNRITATSLEPVSQLVNLVVFDIGNNMISASLPASMSTLVNLNTFNVPNNQIQGQIPQSFFELRNLQQIDLSGNRFSGPFLSLRSDPFVLDISNNSFSGSAQFLSDLNSAQIVRIQNNQFDSQIPALTNLKKLQRFEASRNRFTGEAPQVNQLSVLGTLDLSYNSLEGSIPSMIGNTNLQVLLLQNNKFTEGSLMTPLPSLQVCDLTANSFECPVTFQALSKCKATCNPSLDSSSATVRMRIEGDVANFQQTDFLISLSKALNTTTSRFSIMSVTSGSVIVDIQVAPPAAGQEYEGSASRVVYRMRNTDNSVYAAQGINVISFSDVPKSTLSKGAIAGIVIGAVVFVAILIGIVAFLLVLRRRRLEREAIELENVQKMERLMLDNITIEKIIGSGQFGKVYKADWNGTTVALKGMKAVEDDDTKWKEEITLLQKLNHPNVVRFLGIHKMEGVLYMVLEYAENGSLDTFLTKTENQNSLSTVDLLTMLFDITNGMIYLQSKKVVHRDLAARNILLDGSLHAKISDFGLGSEDKGEEETIEQMPFRWSAPEMIQHKKSSFQSDVWSFGVVAYEIFSLGGIPYKSMVNKEVVTYILEGKRLEQPLRCPDEVYQIMLKCWAAEPRDRPTFDAIRSEIISRYPNLGKQSRLSTTMGNSRINTGADFYATGPGQNESVYKYADDEDLKKKAQPEDVYKFDEEAKRK